LTYFLIDLDPTTITITRHAKVLVAGFTTLTATPLTPIIVRLYNYTTRNAREWVSDTGEVKQIVLGVLAEPTEDIRVGHESYDTFDIADTSSPPDIRTYRIVGVRHYDSPDLPGNFIQCDCVAV
jgi:hypothetical protein